MTILGYLFTRSIKILVSAAITLVIIVINMFKTKSQKEGFSEFKKEDLEHYTKKIKNNYIKQTFTTPTKKNPAMNVLMDEYKYNPKRPPSCTYL